MNKNERCLWIVGTFIDYGDMSLRELNARFLDYTLNYEGEEIQPRTFDRDRRYIASTFQIDIDFDPLPQEISFGESGGDTRQPDLQIPVGKYPREQSFHAGVKA